MTHSPAVIAAAKHEITQDGESTANWFCQQGGFWGTVNQLTRCARCGVNEVHRPNERVHYRDALKPTFHYVCRACHEELPE
jgi:hypothetical protein